VQFIYDGAHRLERLINENGEAYGFVYDRNDNVVQEIGLDGVVKRIDHDPRGLPVKVTDAVGDPDAITLRMQRDALGRLTAKHARGRNTSYRYDQVGNLVQAQQYTDHNGPRTTNFSTFESEAAIMEISLAKDELRILIKPEKIIELGASQINIALDGHDKAIGELAGYLHLVFDDAELGLSINR